MIRKSPEIKENAVAAAPGGDNASRKTTSTGVCETSQTEYISRSKEGDDGEEEDGVQQVKSSVVNKEEEEEAKVEEMARLNVKMLFLHNEQSWILESGPSSQNCRNALNCRIVGRRRRIDGLEGDGRGGGDAAQGGW